MKPKSEKQGIAYGYARLSPKDKESERLSIFVQGADIQAYCLMKHLDLRSIYTDVDVSGGMELARRPSGKQLIAQLDKEPGHVVAVRQDRLFRQTADALVTIKQWLARGITTTLIAEGIDVSTPAGFLMFTIMAGFSQYEREIIGVRTKAILGEMKARGKRVSRTMQYGWDEGPDGTASRNLTEDYWLRWMKNMRSRGHSDSAIAKGLNEKKAPTKTGSIWRPSTVKQILDREGCARPDVSPADLTPEGVDGDPIPDPPTDKDYPGAQDDSTEEK